MRMPNVSTGNEYDWLSIVLSWEIQRAVRLKTAVDKWTQVSEAEFKEFESDIQQQWNPLWDSHGYDPLADELGSLLDTERLMWANLAVTISSITESFLVRVCKSYGLDHIGGNGRADFAIACKSLSQKLATDLRSLPGAKDNQRARHLANCFKHNDRRRDQVFIDAFNGSINEEIEYEKEDWSKMIDDTRLVLESILQLLSQGLTT